MMLSWCTVVVLHPELVQDTQGEVLPLQPETQKVDNNYSYGNYDWLKNKDLTGGKYHRISKQYKG